MAQFTPKTVAEAINWIDTNPHHYASVIDEKGFFILKGHSGKLRIPDHIHSQMIDDIKPGEYLDARMYVPTAKGRRKLNAAKRAGVL